MINIQSFAKAKDGTSYKATSSSGFSNSKNVTTSLDTHNIWGQPFNGTEDVSGNLYNVGSITASGNIQTEGDIIIRQLDEENQVVNDGDLTISVKDKAATFSGKDKYTFDGAIEGTDIKANGNLDVTGASTMNGVTVNGDAAFNKNIEVKGQSKLNDVSSNNITNSDTIKTKNLEVTGSAHFFELIIDKIKAAGGAVLFTPANGFKVDIVESVTNGYKLYWQADDGSGNQADNMWKVNDQALCMSFNQAKEGTNHNISNKYYWSLVTAVSDTNQPVSIEEKKYHYIVISAVTKDGTVNPEIGDTIAMLGYRGTDDKKRQSAIYISAYTSLDKGLTAPLLAQYQGINDFNLESHRKSYFDAVGAKFVGNFEVSNGQTIEDYVNEKLNDVEAAGAPYIGSDGYWYVWDNTLKKYVKTNTKAEGKDGNSINIKGETVGHYRNWAAFVKDTSVYIDIDEEILLDDSSDWSETNALDGTVYTGFKKPTVMRYVSAPDHNYDAFAANIGDCYVDKDGYLWIATASQWNNVGKIRGEDGKDGINGTNGTNGTNGKDAEFYKLQPVQELAVVDKNGTLGISLMYNIKHIKGTNEFTVGASNSGYYVRFKPNTSSGYISLSLNTTAPLYTNAKFQTNYHKQGTKIQYLTVQLVSAGLVKDTRVVPVQFAASATLEITDSIKTTVQDNTTSITDLAGKVQTNTNNISTVTQKANSIESTVSSHTTNINSLTGQVDSNTKNISSITQKANSIESTVSTINNIIDQTSQDRRNLISGSYLRRVTKKYGGRSLTAQIVKGKKYTFSFNGYCTQELLNKGMWLEGFAFDSSWKIQNEPISIKTIKPTTVSKTFTAKYTGEISIDFYPYKDNITQEESAANTAFIVVNWCQLEEGEVATPWTLAEGEPIINPNLISSDINDWLVSGNGSTEVASVINEGCTLPDGSVYDCIHAKYTGTNLFDAVKRDSCISLDSIQSYTLSFYAKGAGTITSYLYPTAVMGWIKPDGTQILDQSSNNSSTDGSTPINLTTEWTKYIITWTALCGSEGTRKNLIIARLSPNTDAYIAGIKIERGGRATAYQRYTDNSISKIVQTAGNIKAEVYDELNKSTGIDIKSGSITLNADKTTIKGNLNITDTQNGLTVYETAVDNNKNILIPRINLQPKEIADITAMANDTYDQYNGYVNQTDNNSWSLTFGSKDIVCKKDDAVILDRASLTEMRSNSSGTNNPPYSTTAKVVIKMQKVVNGTATDKGTREITVTKQNNYGQYLSMDAVRFPITEDGTYRFVFSSVFSQGAVSSYPNMTANLGVRMQKAERVMTYIGTDGMYSHSGANKCFYVNDKKTILQHGFNGIKWDNAANSFGNTAMKVVASVEGVQPNYNAVWYPFYNYTPVFKPNNYKSIQIKNDGSNSYRYAYKIKPLTDCGICYIENAAMDSNFNRQDTWILLPPSYFTGEDGKQYMLPVGYTIEVINGGFGNKGFNAYVSADVSAKYRAVFIDGHRDKNWRVSLNGSVHWEKFIYMGSYYSTDCNSNQDIWMTLGDAQ